MKRGPKHIARRGACEMKFRYDGCTVPVWNGTYVDIMLADFNAVLSGKDIELDIESDYARAVESKTVESAVLKRGDGSEKVAISKDSVRHRAWREKKQGTHPRVRPETA